jgi:hypothetical protein
MQGTFDASPNSPERERAEPQLSPVDSYTQYRLLHQPDQVTHFLNLVTHTSNHPDYARVMAPVLEASARHFSKFGIQLSDDPFQNTQSVYGLRKECDTLPTPDSIPIADISTCWDGIAVGDGMIAVDYSLNGQWHASGDKDAATVLKHMHMYTSGSRDTRHRIITDIHPDMEAIFKREYYGWVKRNELPPGERLELGRALGLQDILIKNPKVYWAYHGFGGNINAFDSLFRKWLGNARERGDKATFIAMEGLGANGSKAEQIYRDIYEIEPDRITIPRYGQQIYEAMLNSGIAGLQAIQKTYIGFSMGAAGLSHAHDLVIADEEEIRESTTVAAVKARSVNGLDSNEIVREERKMNELQPHEPLTFFPRSAMFYFNPAYQGVTTLGGTVSPDAPLRDKLQARATQAVLHIGQFTGREGFRRLPIVPKVVSWATDKLMAGGQASPDRKISSQIHSDSIRDDQAVSFQEREIKTYDGLTPTQVMRISRGNIPAYVFLGNKDRITLASLQRRVIERHAQILDEAGPGYLPHIVFETPNGHGLLFDELMEEGPVLLDVLADLSPHDQMNVRVNLEWIQAAITGDLPDYLLGEIAKMADTDERSANSRLFFDPTGETQPMCIYPTLKSATPDAMKSPAYRARFVSEYIQLIRNRSRTQAVPPPQE